MPSFSGRFEYLQPGQGAVLSGACEVSFDDRTLTIVHGGPALAFDLGDIDVFEADDCRIRLSLFNGHAVLLTRFAKAFQDLERQLREAQRDRLVVCLLVSDLREVLRVGGRANLEGPTGDGKACDGPAELRLYESNLAVLPDAARGFQWRLADIEKVEFDEATYRVVLAQGDERLAVGKLAKRTGEFAEAVQARVSSLGQRSARALHAVFPFLAPDQFTRVAALMREGGCAPVGALRRIHPLTEPALLEQVVDAALAPYVKALAGRCVADWYAGFKIIREEIDPATGDEGEPAETVEEGEAAEAVFAAGDGLEVLYWFFFPIAAGGDAPTHVAWEATSRGGRATYVFALEPGESLDVAVAALNRGLVAVSFRREPVYLQTARLESDVRYRHYAIALRRMPELARLRSSFAGRAIHTSLPSWSTTIERLLGRQPA
jgi:hypothetical protein